MALAMAADAAWRDQSCPAPERADLYFGGVAEARTFHLTLVIDDAAPLERDFSAAEARALAQGGLFHFGCLRLTAGTHHLLASLQWSHDGVSQPPQPVRLEQAFERPLPGTLFELRLHGRLLGTALELTFHSGKAWEAGSGWRALLGLAEPEERGNQFVLGGAGDPRVRQARFLLNTGRAMSAAAVLRDLAVETQNTAPAPRFPLELGRAELAYGLSAAAEARWRATPELAFTRGQRAVLNLDLAQYYYQRGELAVARELLGAPEVPRPPRPDAALAARQSLYSMVLLAQGHLEQAAEVLRQTFNAADYESWVRYYNLGVALIQNGQAPQGLTVLNRIGSLGSNSPLVRRLRDHANLVLARHFLEAGQGATAIPLFGRIESAGPDSASALLGLGWAWLAPVGTLQPEIQLGDEVVTGAPPETLNGSVPDLNDQNLYRRFHIAPFTQDSVPADEAARLRRALSAWMVVADHIDPNGRAEEAMIDIAWALRRLGAEQQALQYDERAATALDQECALLDAAAAQVRNEHEPDLWLASDKAVEPGSPWEMPALPAPPAAPYLLDLLASHPFQAALHDYRDLRLLQGVLGDASDAGFRADLQAAIRAQRVLLRDFQIHALEMKRQRVETLLLYARNALIRVYDNPEAAMQLPH